MVAWAFLALATVALAAMLRVVVALSERRAAFVSAVTHELRTPLTTFRLYAEMLADDMICDPTQRREYLETLRAEADRLSHLVENVLQYARLERGASSRRERVSLDDLLERIEPRLQQRAAQAAMTLEVEADEPLRSRHIATDPAAVEQILFNLVDNACKYARGAADRRIHCSVHARRRTVEFHVRDHGPGIAAKEAGNLFRPFSKSADDAANSAPGVGLGLALCRRLARQLGGRLQWNAAPDGGAVFTLRLPGGKGDAAL
jgi:signal transduction histidine kinase